MISFLTVNLRMATATVLKGLRTRADQADAIITQLKQEISILQTATALTSGREEEERLKEENNALRKEIEKVKLSLMVAEIKNGVRQIPIPQQRNLTTAADPISNGGDSSAPALSLVKEKGGAEQPQAKKAKEAEKAKEALPAAKGGNKAAASKDAETVEEKIDISKLDLRIGKIIDVQKHPDADTLYVETVDIGEDKPRTIVSGLVNHVPIEQMRDRVAVFMCNLKASKMRGISSEGMIMCAKDNKVEILEPPPGVIPGDRITFDGYPGVPDKQLNPKKKIWETLKPDIRTNAERVASYKGVPFKVEGKGIVKAPTLANAEIS